MPMYAMEASETQRGTRGVVQYLCSASARLIKGAAAVIQRVLEAA